MKFKKYIYNIKGLWYSSYKDVNDNQYQSIYGELFYKFLRWCVIVSLEPHIISSD